MWVRWSENPTSGHAAQSTNAQALNANSATQDGIRAFTSHNSTATGTGRSGAFGQDISSDGGHLDAGVAGFSNTGVGVVGLSNNWVGVSAVGGFYDTGTNDEYPALSIVGDASGGFLSDLIDACKTGTVNPCDSLHSIFRVDFGGNVATGGITTDSVTAFGDIQAAGLGSGNVGGIPAGGVNITGSYEKNGFCLIGCVAATTATAGHAVTSYASMVSQPTIEDFGEAQLVNGRSYVPLDSKFANVVDQKANYFVFITPEGEANTLYVTQKSSGGFAVREIQGGRSTILFSYRIVAKPFGSHEARLPMVELPLLHHDPLRQARQRSDGIGKAPKMPTL